MTPDRKTRQAGIAGPVPLKDFSRYVSKAPSVYVPSKSASMEPPGPEIEYEVSDGCKLTFWFNEKAWALFERGIHSYIDIPLKGRYRIDITPYGTGAHIVTGVPPADSPHPNAVLVRDQSQTLGVNYEFAGE